MGLNQGPRQHCLGYIGLLKPIQPMTKVELVQRLYVTSSFSRSPDQVDLVVRARINIERAVAETAARALQATSTPVMSCGLPPAD